MYYKEMIIDGVLCVQSIPNGEFKPITAEQLTTRLGLAKVCIARKEEEKNTLLNALHRIQSVYDWEADFAGEVAHNTLKAFDYSFNENGSIVSK